MIENNKLMKNIEQIYNLEQINNKGHRNWECFI